MLMEASLPHFDHDKTDDARLFVVMGVAGCGKSSIGEALAIRLGGQFLDGDTYHPPENVAKMSRGEPLTDEDRWPWLKRFGTEMSMREGIVVGGCSALKRVYRETITNAANASTIFIYLAGSRELIGSRMGARTGHFMPTSLLDSQFATLEPPTADENAVTIDIDAPIEVIVDRILAATKGK